MLQHSFLIAAGGAAGESQGSFWQLQLLFIGLIFYFVLILPMRNKQKKVETMLAALKPGDRVIVNPGIFATVDRLEDTSLYVRVDDKTKLRVLKSAIAEKLEDSVASTEKK
jgi:preprotein translocase subunit YajC